MGAKPKQFAPLGLTLFLVATLCACGQKGPLNIPETQEIQASKEAGKTKAKPRQGG